MSNWPLIFTFVSEELYLELVLRLFLRVNLGSWWFPDPVIRLQTTFSPLNDAKDIRLSQKDDTEVRVDTLKITATAHLIQIIQHTSSQHS